MKIWISILILVFSFSGCSIHQPLDSADTTLALPDTFSQNTTTMSQDKWWNAFQDENLTNLVETALLANYSIRSSWSRLDQANQLARISGASRFPSLNAELTGSNMGYEDGKGPMGADEVESWQTVATVSWQLDIWQKIANTSHAASLDAEASRFDLEATAQTIAGSVADTWFSLVAERETLRLLSDQAAVSQNYLDLVEYRFSNGLASALEVYQQRSAVAAVDALVPESDASVTVLENTLNLLLGREPGTAIPNVLTLPDLPPGPMTGVPADMLRKRPDVRSAELHLIASDHRLAAAIADRLPSIGISAGIGSQASEFKHLLDDWFTSLAGNLLTPVFDAGRLKAEADRNRAVVEERFLTWESALLGAWNEVENKLAVENGTMRSLSHVDGQVDLARITLERSRDQYMNGLIEYLNVLNSLQHLQQLERQRIRTQQALLSNRVALHLALGGDWSRELKRKHETKAVTTEAE